MEKTYILLIVIYSICVCNGEGEANHNCDSDKCYRDVNTTHADLLELLHTLNSTSSSATISKPYSLKPFKDLVKEVEKIGRESQNIVSKLYHHNDSLNHHRGNIADDRDAVDRMLEKLSNISEINSADEELSAMLSEAQKKYSTFKHVFDSKQNASKTCEDAENEYVKLEKTVNNTVSNYDKLRKKYDRIKNSSAKINKDLNETLQDAIKNKNDFEQLQLPYNVEENYLNETDAKFHSLINYLKNNSDILAFLLEDAYNKMSDQIKKEYEELQGTLSQIQSDLDDMNDNLRMYEDALIKIDFNTTVNNETLQLISLIEKELLELEINLNLTDFSDEEKYLLKKQYVSKDIIRENTEKLKNYTLILDMIPASEEKLRNIELELRKLRVSITLNEQSKILAKKLEHLRKVKDELSHLDCMVLGVLT